MADADIEPINLCMCTCHDDTVAVVYPFFQLKNAFDNLFDDLMESKEGEKQEAEVFYLFICLWSAFCFIL